MICDIVDQEREKDREKKKERERETVLPYLQFFRKSNMTIDSQYPGPCLCSVQDRETIEDSS